MALSFDDARSLILESASPLGVERVPLLDAFGRVLADGVLAPWDMPRWNNSAMDGYAVRAADCATLGTELTIAGYLPAGARANGVSVPPRGAVKIMTGAPIPANCDAVIPVEETAGEGERIRILASVKAGDHIRWQGEDVKRGEVIMPAGTVLRPAEISMLASFGQVFAAVHRRPRVAILSTGDELVELGELCGEGQIINSNSLSLAAAVKEAGGEAILLGIARDDRESLLPLLREGLKADVLITSAGVSAGDRDFVREVLAELGVHQHFWKIDIKPGRPTAFGVWGETLVFALPGNPVSTMVTFEMFVRPALRRLLGYQRVIQPTVRAKLNEAVRKKPGRTQFLRVQVRQDGETLIASSSGDQNTGILRTMVRANAIAILRGEAGQLPAGSSVELHLLDPSGLV
jgi:molybdopterin molybdotransferase